MRLVEDYQKTGNRWWTRKYDLENPADMVRYVARQRFSWPGGGELFIVTSSGDVLCQDCIRENYRQELSEAIDETFSPYAIESGYNIDPESCYCENCGKDLSSYCENEGR